MLKIDFAAGIAQGCSCRCFAGDHVSHHNDDGILKILLVAKHVRCSVDVLERLLLEGDAATQAS